MKMSDLPLPPTASRTVPVLACADGRRAARADCVALETPVALEFNGIAHAVMMATPLDLEDFALGFALSECIVAQASDIYALESEATEQGWIVRLEVASECFARLKGMRRTLAGRTGCGLCGTESLVHALRRPPPVRADGRVAPAALARAMQALQEGQPLRAQTGSTHAAAWCTPEGGVVLLREDVGRHNALDKLIGALARAGVPAAGGFIAITSRASHEMVQKAAQAGVGLLAAVSGVTSLAVDVAQHSGLTLLGFVRGNDFNIYTHPHRVTGSAPA